MCAVSFATWALLSLSYWDFNKIRESSINDMTFQRWNEIQFTVVMIFVPIIDTYNAMSVQKQQKETLEFIENMGQLKPKQKNGSNRESCLYIVGL